MPTLCAMNTSARPYLDVPGWEWIRGPASAGSLLFEHRPLADSILTPIEPAGGFVFMGRHGKLVLLKQYDSERSRDTTLGPQDSVSFMTAEGGNFLLPLFR